MIYIIAQIIGLIGFLFSLIAYHRNKKNKILNFMICSNILYLIHYIFLNAYSGCLTKVVAILRDICIVNIKNKLLSNILLCMFIIIYILIAVFTYTSIWSLLPLTAAIIYLLPVWKGNDKAIRIVAFIGYFLWLSYNIYILSMAGIISNIVSILSVLLAIKKYKR